MDELYPLDKPSGAGNIAIICCNAVYGSYIIAAICHISSHITVLMFSKCAIILEYKVYINSMDHKMFFEMYYNSSTYNTYITRQ